MILTVDEAVAELGEYDDTADTDKITDVLTAVDAYITASTGYVVAAPVNGIAKQIARMLLVHWWDSPDGQTMSSQKASQFGIEHLLIALRNIVDVAADSA